MHMHCVVEYLFYIGHLSVITIFFMLEMKFEFGVKFVINIGPNITFSPVTMSIFLPQMDSQ